jgi:hypothetical protein
VTQITLSRIPSSSRRLAALVLLCALVALPAFAAGEVETQFGGGSVSWQINRTSGAATLTVHTDAGVLVSRTRFDAGVTPVFQPSADGAYRWSLAVAPQLNAEQKAELEAARARGDEQAASRFEGIMVSGRFAVENGLVHETGFDRGSRDQDPVGGINVKDQVIPDDLIVQGSICSGFDCVNNESFGFDTIRLKENNLRIKFEDTSVGAFPSNDWQLTANDSASGGANKFSIEDITGARVPFTVTAGATTNSIFVDSSGRVGFRTSTPRTPRRCASSRTTAAASLPRPGTWPATKPTSSSAT